MLGHAWTVTALNPSGLTFFVAYLPQFLVADAPLLPQMIAFEATFIGLAVANVLGHALLAALVRTAFRYQRALGNLNRISGVLLAGLGVAAIAIEALARR